MCKKEEADEGVSQAYVVAESLAEALTERTAGMTKEQVWEVADHLGLHCTGVQEMIDDGKTEEHLLADPAYGEPAWGEDHDEDEGEGEQEAPGRFPPFNLEGVKTGRYSHKRPFAINTSKARSASQPGEVWRPPDEIQERT